MKSIISLCAALCLGAVLPPAAQADNMSHGSMHMDMPAKDDASQLSEGTVKKINAGAGWITIAHGPLVNLGMSPMTMTFTARDKALLKGVKAGDKVRFRAEQAGEALIVTKLSVVR